MLLGNKATLESGTREINNETILLAIAKICNSTINKLAVDNTDILYTPTNVNELEENTTMLNSIIGLKIKNNLIKK